MAQRVASSLGIPVALIWGTIASAHIYLEDLPQIRALLDEAAVFCGQDVARHGGSP
jgi:thymidylate synthase